MDLQHKFTIFSDRFLLITLIQHCLRFRKKKGANRIIVFDIYHNNLK